MIPVYSSYAQQGENRLNSNDRRPLGEVLIEFQASVHIDLLWDPDLVANEYTSFILRPGPPEALLRELLQGTRLEFHRLRSGTYVLTPARTLIPAPGSVGGVVLDQTTGEPLPFAHVLLADVSSGTATDATGLFNFAQIRPGRYRIMATYLGYGVQTDTVQVRPAEHTELKISLEPVSLYIAPLIVEDTRSVKDQDAASELWYNNTSGFRHTLAETDLLRGLNQLMGVQVGDAMADVHVQGGESGEHQFRLDGVPLFEPVHLRGLLGAFNPFALQKITLYKAGFGAPQGSHLSGVIAAEHALGRADGYTMDVQVDPLSFNGRFQAEIGNPDGVSGQFMTAIRTGIWGVYPSHLYSPLYNLLREWNTPDLFLLRFSALAQKDRIQLDPVTAGLLDTLLIPINDPEFGFNDFHAAARLRLSAGRSIYASAYRGWNQINGNQISVSLGDPDQAPRQNVDAVAGSADSDSSGVPSRDNYQWVNSLGQIRYSSLLGSRAFYSIKLRGSQYLLTHGYNAPVGSTVVYPTPDGPIPLRQIKDLKPTDDGNRIREVALESTLDFSPGKNHYVQLGVEAAGTEHRFSIEDVSYVPIFLAASGWRLAFMGEEKTTLGEHITMRLGSRATILSQQGTFYAEPRFEIQYDQNSGSLGTWSLQGAAGLYRQFVNQFSVSSFSPSALLSSIRFWLPVDSTVRPPKAYHVAGALRWNPSGSWDLRLETYYKKQTHLLDIDYQALWELADEPGDSTARVQSAFLSNEKGYSYGGALKIERMGPQTRMLARYEYSKAMRTRNMLRRYSEEVNSGAYSESQQVSLPKYEPVPWGEPHRLELALDWIPSPQFTMTVRWHGAWGRTWAFRQAYYDYIPATTLTQDPVYGPYDFRKPYDHKLKPFYQLDMGMAYTHVLGPAALQVRVDVLNALNRANEADWRLEIDPEKTSSSTGSETPTPKIIPRTLLPRMPSVALRLRW